MRIGIFDSGIGGVSILKYFAQAEIFDEIIYYGDTARVPYGTKTKETIIKYSLEALDFFAPFALDFLVIACNTASAYALPSLQKHSKIPVIGVIDAGVRALQNKIQDKNAKILICATQATTNSQSYPLALQKLGYTHITSLATSLFVPMVEEGIFEGPLLNECFKYYFDSIQTPDAIILGCTHFPFIAKAIDDYFHHQSILIHSGEAILSLLQEEHLLPQIKTRQSTKIRFFSSQDSQSLETMAQKLLKI